MPIGNAEFQAGRRNGDVENDITAFLNERKEMAFTSEEIMAGVRFPTNFNTPETTRISTYAVADFIALLYEMVTQGKVRTKIVEGQMYFAAEKRVATCPKCGAEVAEPKKTWKMTGRPDKKGRRFTVQIGLFRCPSHGNFRVALSKVRT